MAKAITAPVDERHGLGDERLRWILRQMIVQRTLDNRGFQLNRQGKIPFATGLRRSRSVAGRCGNGVCARKRRPRSVLPRLRARVWASALDPA